MPRRVVSGIQQTLDQNTETALGTSGLEQALLRPPFLLETMSKAEDSELSHLTDTPIPPIQLLQASKGQHPAISVPEVKWDFPVTLLSKKKKKNEGREGGRKGKKEREEGRKGRKERGKERGKKGGREGEERKESAKQQTASHRICSDASRPRLENRKPKSPREEGVLVLFSAKCFLPHRCNQCVP